MNVLRDYYIDVKSKTNIRLCLYVKLKKMTQAYSQNRLKLMVTKGEVGRGWGNLEVWD